MTSATERKKGLCGPQSAGAVRHDWHVTTAGVGDTSWLQSGRRRQQTSVLGSLSTFSSVQVPTPMNGVTNI